MSAGPRAGPLRLLHLPGPLEDCAAPSARLALLRKFGRGVTHSVAAAPGAGPLPRDIPAHLADLPDLAGPSGLVKLQAMAEAMRGYDLILTYGWQAMKAVLAHTLFAARLALPPLVHHEDRLPADEAARPKLWRTTFRMLALARSQALVVASPGLEQVALGAWRQPRTRVHRIPYGIDTAAFAARPRRDALPRVIKRPGELFLGTFAGQSPADLAVLVRALAALPPAWHLVILGQVEASEPLLGEAVELEVGHRVHLAGAVADLGRVLGLFDMFVLRPEPEAFPLATLQAMAAGLPLVSAAAGDAAGVVGEGSRRFLVPPGDEPALAQALSELACDNALRAKLGAENRARARAEFDQTTMFARYARVYAGVTGRESFP